jgi:stage II sporulation protein M
LQGFFSLAPPEEPAAQLVFSTFFLYFRYPLLAFLLGFASVGVLLLPAATLAYGFFLSFSVCCLTAAFGREGVLLALAVFGLRCLITLPCYFAVAVPALEKSFALAMWSFARPGRSAPPVYGRAWWLRLSTISAALSMGVAIDLLISPSLLHWVLNMILQTGS